MRCCIIKHIMNYLYPFHLELPPHSISPLNESLRDVTASFPAVFITVHVTGPWWYINTAGRLQNVFERFSSVKKKNLRYNMCHGCESCTEKWRPHRRPFNPQLHRPHFDATCCSFCVLIDIVSKLLLNLSPIIIKLIDYLHISYIIRLYTIFV